jgi:hypothetical protein
MEQPRRITNAEYVAKFRAENPERAREQTRRASTKFRARRRIKRQAEEGGDLAFTDREPIELDTEKTGQPDQLPGTSPRQSNTVPTLA